MVCIRSGCDIGVLVFWLCNSRTGKLVELCGAVGVLVPLSA